MCAGRDGERKRERGGRGRREGGGEMEEGMKRTKEKWVEERGKEVSWIIG